MTERILHRRRPYAAERMDSRATATSPGVSARRLETAAGTWGRRANAFGDAMHTPVAFSRRGLHVLGIVAVLSSAMWGAGIWGLLQLLS